jgi:hypothetical protein
MNNLVHTDNNIRIKIIDLTSYRGCRLCSTEYDTDEVIKELAVFDLQTDWCQSFVFRAPYPEHKVDPLKTAINNARYKLTVKIKWSEGDVPYLLLPKILEMTIDSSQFIIIGGRRCTDQAKLLSGFMKNCKISIMPDVDPDQLPDLTGIACKFHKNKKAANYLSSLFCSSSSSSFPAMLAYAQNNPTEMKQFCPLNRCLKLSNYIKNDFGIHNVPKLQQTWNYGLPSVPRNVMQQLVRYDQETLKKAAECYLKHLQCFRGQRCCREEKGGAKEKNKCMFKSNNYYHYYKK